MKARARRRMLLTAGTVTALAVTGPLAGAAMAAALTFSTYLGGTNDEAAAWFGGIVSIAVDDLGNRYVTGSTRSPDFPTTEGAKRTLSGDLDIFVTKIAPGGTILYSTYLGGPCDDSSTDIAVDAEGNAYLTGRVHGGVCTADVNAGALVAKLDPTGGMVYAAVLGGALADTSLGHAIAVDAAGHAYVAGTTSSHDFPITAGAFRTQDCSAAFSAGADGFVAKLSTDGTTLEYSTFLCGTAHESLNGIAVDAAGSAYVVGSTESKDFPTVTAIQAAPLGGPTAVTGFVTKLLPDGSGLAYSTYLGGSTNDLVDDVALDAQGNVYLTGETQSDDFPTTPGVVQEHPGNRLCFYTLCSDAFVTKIDASGRVAYSTLLYGEGNDAGSRIAVDALGDAYVVGSTSSLYFPIVGAFQPASRGPGDAFVTKLDPDGTHLLYSSYLGGSHTGASPLIGDDIGTSIAVDVFGNAHVAGYTLSFDFPTTENATQKSIGDGVCDVAGTPCGDAFVASIWADGPRTVPPIDLVAEPAADGSVSATWRGLPAVTDEDQVRLYSLGSYGADSDALGSWSTDGFADGTAGLILPGGLPPGWYELRLLVPDAEWHVLTTVARSEPFRAGTPGVTTPTGPGTCDADAACEDGDPCTVEVCVAGGCISKPTAGVASVTCACQRPEPAVCAGQRVPPAVDRRLARVCASFDGAATKRTPPLRRLKRDVATLGGSIGAVAKARKKRRISNDCATALETELRDAKDRAARMLVSLSGR